MRTSTTGLALFASLFCIVLSAQSVRAEMTVPGAHERWAANGPGGSPDFTRHIVPLFGKAGCNNRACHGSFRGQNGFRLSLFGFEPENDLKELTEDDGDGPRVDREFPDLSLALLKPTKQDPHKGGERFGVDSWQYRMFLQWIADGAKYEPKDAAKIVRFEITPSEIILAKGDEPAPLRTFAYFSDGTREEVTALTIFSTNDESVAKVDEDGRVTPGRIGDTAIIAQYGGAVASTQVLIPFPDDGSSYPPFPPTSPVDDLVVAKLKKLNIRPSGLSSDSEFLRRVYVDMIGTLPTADEARDFLADKDPEKRARLIDRLLERPEYAIYWATKFSDWTGNGEYVSFDPTKANWMWQLWLQDKLAKNVPYDELVYGYVCATSMEGRPREQYLDEVERVLAANAGRGNFDDGVYAQRRTLDLYWIKVQHRDPATIALQTANAFLGVRLECAQCHNHPFDRWTQNDYESFKTFFMYGRYCDPKTGEEARAGKRMYGNESYEHGISGRHRNEIRKTPPRLLGGEQVPLDDNSGDPRLALWEWMKSPENEFFAPALVNRIWAHYFGVGIVDPADDFNQGNPPSNPQLLDWLAKDFIASGYDLKHVHRRIANSRTYQLSWRPNESNRLDETNFSHALLRRVPAEPMIDAIADVTGAADVFDRAPAGVEQRAIGFATPTARHSISRKGYAMRIFGRPERDKTCDCERSSEPSVAQAMYLMNDREINEKIADRNGRVSQLLRANLDDRQIVEELYLTALSRYPTEAEMQVHLSYIGGAPSRRDGVQDVMWTLLNVREFVFLH